MIAIVTVRLSLNLEILLLKKTYSQGRHLWLAKVVFITQKCSMIFSFFYNLLKHLSYVEELMSLFGIAIATESKFIQ